MQRKLDDVSTVVEAAIIAKREGSYCLFCKILPPIIFAFASDLNIVAFSYLFASSLLHSYRINVIEIVPSLEMWAFSV